MSPYKPWKKRDYLKWIGAYGWKLQKAGIDWKLVDQHGKLQVRNILITHPGGEIPPISINKTQEALREAGLE